ncbi:MAG: hypothetical protein QXV17_07800 [Candidatus Micrarchaeaceae archaeon]
MTDKIGNRPFHRVSPNLYVYDDDPYHLLLYENEETKKLNLVGNDAMFVKNIILESFLAPEEMELVKYAREINNEKDSVPTPAIEAMKKKYIDQLNILTYKTEPLLKAATGNSSTALQKQEQEHGKLETTKGEFTSIAQMYGIPPDVANLFFVSIEGNLYIKNPALLYLANKKGYQAIVVSDEYKVDEKGNGYWEATTLIYPKVSEQMIEAISKLPPELQEVMIEYVTRPTNGKATASKETLKTEKNYKYMREIAQTRSQNRALRAYTGYGGTSYEELSEANPDVE